MNRDFTARSSAVGGLVVVVVLIVGCDDQQTRPPTRNLQRPGPLALFCAGLDDEQRPAGLPLERCSATAEEAADAGQAKGTLLGLVANTARGDVALFRTETSGEPLIDLDEAPGFGFLPVGSLPSDLAVTSDGCRAVTANSGSCDLSWISLPAALSAACRTEALRGPLTADLNGVCKGDQSGAGRLAVVSRIIPHTADGPLLARPQEVVVRSSSPGQCSRDTPYRAYVTFPTCNMVAEMDLNSGRVLEALVFDVDGRPRFTDRPRCAAECGGPRSLPDGGVEADTAAADFTLGDAGGDGAAQVDTAVDSAVVDGHLADAHLEDVATPDAGATDVVTTDAAPDARVMSSDSGDADGSSDGGQAAAYAARGPLPFSLALAAGESKLFVSAAGAAFMSVIDVGADGGFVGTRAIPLEGDRVGVRRIVVSPQTQALGQFVYALAADRTLRVVSVELERECETQPDLLLTGDRVPIQDARCLPVGDTVRRVLAEGPGISFGSRVPQDVTFVDKDNVENATQENVLPMQGVYAFVALSDGNMVVVDVEDRTVIAADSSSVPRLRLPHHIRNSLLGEEGADTPDLGVEKIEGARSGGVPVIVSALNGKGLNKVIDGVALAEEGVVLLAPGEPVAGQRLVYEPTLVDRFSGELKSDGKRLELRDSGADFCGSGVLGRIEVEGRAVRHGDIMTLVGCNDNKDCGLGQVCRRPLGRQGSGLCLDADRQDELFAACSPWLRGEREFLVREARPTSLLLDVLPLEPQRVIRQETQPDQPCTSNADCDPEFLCALGDRAVDGKPELSLQKGECFRSGCDPRAEEPQCPEGQTCVRPAAGSLPVCAPVPLPLDPSKCFPELQHYRVLAGRSFVVSGGFGRVREDPANDNQCAASASDTTFQDRIDVGLPVFPVAVGRPCAVLPSWAGDPDDLTAVPQRPVPNGCVEVSSDKSYEGFVSRSSESAFRRISDDPPTIFVHYSNPDLGFSLGLSHLVRLSTDTVGTSGQVAAPDSAPMPVRGLTITLKANSGYQRLVVPRSSRGLTIALPARLVGGPDGYIYVADMGDSTGTESNRGQVVRFHGGDENLAYDLDYGLR